MGLSSEELAFCFFLNPLSLYYLWTAVTVPINTIRAYVALQFAFNIIVIYFHMGRSLGRHVFTAAMVIPFSYLLFMSEIKKGVACNRTLFMVRE
mgnify:CR=1 FL=1